MSDTDPTAPDIEASLAEIQALTAANDAIIVDMRRQGAQVDMGSLLALRLFTLLDKVLGPLEGDDKTPQRVAYELECQRRFADQLAQAQAQIRQAVLLHGVQLNGHGGRS